MMMVTILMLIMIITMISMVIIMGSHVVVEHIDQGMSSQSNKLQLRSGEIDQVGFSDSEV